MKILFGYSYIKQVHWYLFQGIYCYKGALTGYNHHEE